jgi:uncharacterized protein
MEVEMAPQRNGETPSELADWRDRTRVFLQPIAAPSILGLFGFALSTFTVSAQLDGWYGTPRSGMFLFPFTVAAGGLAQFAAAMWGYRARDGLATAVHGIWGSFWIGYGILNLLAATGDLTLPTTKFPELGFWFFMLAAFTIAAFFAAFAETLGLVAVLGPLAVGAAFLGVGFFTGVHGWVLAGSWLLIAAAIAAFYSGTALMLENAYGRTILPLGKYTAAANVPGRVVTRRLEYAAGEPGVRQGQ